MNKCSQKHSKNPGFVWPGFLFNHCTRFTWVVRDCSSNLPGLPRHLGIPSVLQFMPSQVSWQHITKSPKGRRAANGTKAGKQELCQLEKWCAHLAMKLMCILISFQPHQHMNRWYFFRFSSKNQLNKTHAIIYFVNGNNQEKQIKPDVRLWH